MRGALCPAGGEIGTGGGKDAVACPLVCVVCVCARVILNRITAVTVTGGLALLISILIAGYIIFPRSPALTMPRPKYGAVTHLVASWVSGIIPG